MPSKEVAKPMALDGMSPMMGQGMAARGNENWVPGRGERYGDGSVGCGDGKVQGSLAGEGKHMGSRRMVDMFLSSRRRMIKGSEESGASAFI